MLWYAILLISAKNTLPGAIPELSVSIKSALLDLQVPVQGVSQITSDLSTPSVLHAVSAHSLQCSKSFFAVRHEGPSCTQSESILWEPWYPGSTNEFRRTQSEAPIYVNRRDLYLTSLASAHKQKFARSSTGVHLCRKSSSVLPA